MHGQAEFDRVVTSRIALMALCALSPFALYWMLRGDLVMSVVVAGVVLFTAGMWYAIRCGASASRLKYFMAGACAVGAVAAVHVIGESGVYWVFPSMVATYYLLPQRAALGYNLTAYLLLLPATASHPDVYRVMVTLLMTNVFGYIFSGHIVAQRAELSRLALLDSLTGAGNRRSLEARLEEAVAAQRRYRVPASLLLLDLDHFKQVNDRHGHVVGDAVLIELARLIRQRIRSADSLFRFGGEEFVVLAPSVGQEAAARLAEDLRRAVQAAELLRGESLTISVGVAELLPDEEPRQWLQRADAALYCCKDEGRNRVHQAELPAHRLVG